MSAKFSLNVKDISSLAKNAILVGTAAVLTYVMENINSVDWGTTGVLLVPVVTLLLDAIVKWVKGPKVVDTK
jgi:hypothetical protein